MATINPSRPVRHPSGATEVYEWENLTLPEHTGRWFIGSSWTLECAGQYPDEPNYRPRTSRFTLKRFSGQMATFA